MITLTEASKVATGEPRLTIYLGEPEVGDQLVERGDESLLYAYRTPVSAAFYGSVVNLVETIEGVGSAIRPPENGREARS